MTTFAILAFLMGAFSFNANAKGASDDRNIPQTVVKEDWNKVIDNYVGSVNDCLKLYNQLQSNRKDEKTLRAQFEETLSTVETLGTKIEKNKDQLNRTQLHKYNEAKSKLSVIYTKTGNSKK